MIQSVLVANRGEIALRIVRGARELGLRTVAVFSEADRASPHVLAADEAYPIGPARAAESYLAGARLVEVARRAGVDAVHPGYGFLAERADFARQVADAGLVFVGPAAATIQAMGDKTEARRRMEAAGVPVVPGTHEALGSGEEARRTAESVGFPVILKAAAGGGGKGMRVVRSAGEVPAAFAAAVREAESAFGDGAVYVERCLERPRHIEIQLFGDSHGSVVHLHERECSIQRRHQKLVEEAPSPLLSAEERRRMGEAAVRAARAVDYVGAGTVEFLHAEGEFFFLEMNTRLQVEHPVTEMVTGVDLVEWQLRIASGEPLPLRQEQIPLAGHAVECRITSESPFDGFLPSTGVIDELELPGGPWVRWDGGVARGSEVGLHYDPLLGKLVAWGRDRETAVRRMRRALAELKVRGVATSAPLLAAIMDEPDYRAGCVTTAYLEEHPELFEASLGAGERRTLAVAGALLEHAHRSGRAAPRLRRDARALSAWQRAASPVAEHGSGLPQPDRARDGPGSEPGAGAIPRGRPARYVAAVAGERHEVEIGAGGAVVADGIAVEAALETVSHPARHSLLLNGRSTALLARRARRGRWKVDPGGGPVEVEVLTRRQARIRDLSAGAGGAAAIKPLAAPMPGLVVQVAVNEGDVVEAGSALVIIEAMKMENELRAAAAARVARVLVGAGDAVEKGQVLLDFAPAEAS